METTCAHILLTFLAAFVWVFFAVKSQLNSEVLTQFVTCVGLGFFSSTAYCLRSIYINYCVLKKWDPKWDIWYYCRPFIGIYRAITVFFIWQSLSLVFNLTNQWTLYCLVVIASARLSFNKIESSNQPSQPN